MRGVAVLRHARVELNAVARVEAWRLAVESTRDARAANTADATLAMILAPKHRGALGRLFASVHRVATASPVRLDRF
nr:hypothetical protein [Tanacetum cinerariifolium]